jgi:hypothetical protein
MSTSEILDQLTKLGRSEREKVWQRLEELELAEIEETPEMLAAIDAGRASISGGKTHTVEEARELIANGLGTC